MEPYLRTSSVAQTSSSADSLQQTEAVIKSSSSRYIQGGSLSQGKFNKQEIYVPEKTTGTLTVYTASPSTIVELVSPDGTITPASKPDVDQTIFSGANLYAFDLPDFVPGTWTVQMKATD